QSTHGPALVRSAVSAGVDCRCAPEHSAPGCCGSHAVLLSCCSMVKSLPAQGGPRGVLLMSETTGQRIGIIGTGAIGGFYGLMLARAGMDVHFLLRSEYPAVAERGIQLNS